MKVKVSDKVSIPKVSVEKKQAIQNLAFYLKTVLSSCEMALAYCSVGWVPILLLQHFSCLLISSAHSNFRLSLFLAVLHFL